MAVGRHVPGTAVVKTQSNISINGANNTYTSLYFEYVYIASKSEKIKAAMKRYYGDPLSTGVNALSPYIVAKKSPEFSHNFRTISARTSYLYIFAP